MLRLRAVPRPDPAYKETQFYGYISPIPLAHGGRWCVQPRPGPHRVFIQLRDGDRRRVGLRRRRRVRAYTQYGDLSGKEVNIYASILSPELEMYEAAFVPFEECTGANLIFEGSSEFEAQLKVREKAGNPPDIALIPQPGLLANQVATGSVKKPSATGGEERRRELDAGLEDLRLGGRRVLRARRTAPT